MAVETGHPAVKTGHPTVETEHPAGARPAFQPRIVAFCCNWCSYAGADLAGTSRMPYPASVRVIRVPCSGRINPRFVLRALQRGADGVLIAGCHPGDCHYSTGNYYTRRRLLLASRLLSHLGFEPGRLWIRWISGSEGGKFADTIKEMTASLQAVGPNLKGREVGRES